jgi:hypothetical protein
VRLPIDKFREEVAGALRRIEATHAHLS